MVLVAQSGDKEGSSRPRFTDPWDPTIEPLLIYQLVSGKEILGGLPSKMRWDPVGGIIRI